ncbi:isoaspartyl peptidase/L-asparaginase [Sphingomonas sp. CROZ-RG-20F-R02-07]|uniref:isoaspartyl peptidase/L-asparaginase family protein n=1 Tax=Sphingomonas sp. CROZ-RG-20F-R02-07 TaxID=2914832 RepID=UPI001F55B973|nr:isoaspartyl peptidase/L-asparaginase [Sphingomonas sp. CROZ-RG-20F-R02-07]
MTNPWTIAVHGGAGRLTRSTLTREQDAGARAGLTAALAAGAAVLDTGGTALDAVEAAVRVLEDDPHFNAGRGAVFTHDGGIELDAAIMDGRTRGAGAVAGVTATRSPVALARRVMAEGRHVLLAGPAADSFGDSQGLERAAPGWFETDERRRQYAELMADGGDGFDAGMKYGTVGAVARDGAGHLAAATSTGGVTGKRWGRIGDSPIIGAGTWADDRSVAVSCTGSGESFLRVGVGHEIDARVRLAGQDAAEATRAVLAEVESLGGTGGAIVVGGAGPAHWAFVTPGMNRGMRSAGGEAVVAIYGDERIA